MQKIKPVYERTKTFALAHKVVSTLIVIALIAGIYSTVKAASVGPSVTKYIIGTVTNGTVISTVTGSGQVSALNQVPIQSKVSGAITSLNVKDGDPVTAGELLLTIDSTDAARSLQSAQIALEKLEEAAAPATLTQTTGSVTSAYENSFNDVANAFLNLPTIISGVDNMLVSETGYLSSENTQYLSQTSQDYRNQAQASDSVADQSYTTTENFYKNVTRQSSTSTIESLVQSAYTTAKNISQAIKDEQTAVDFIQSQASAANQSKATPSQTDLATWTGEINNYLATFLSDEESMTANTQSLEKLVSGADPLDIQSQELAIQAAQETYNNYFVSSPIDGIISLAVKPTDTISSGETIGTVVSKQQIATISLNEIDAAKVAVGDKATLTFDAINNLSIAGHVSDVGIIGTVSSGVVTYTITITLDTNDSRIKPGMSINASIDTDVENNVLTVPNSAIKTQGAISYVQELNQTVPAASMTTGVTSATPPKNVPVQVGISNGTVTEILSGLSAGDQIITKTTTSGPVTTTTTASAAPSILGGSTTRGGSGFGGVARGL